MAEGSGRTIASFHQVSYDYSLADRVHVQPRNTGSEEPAKDAAQMVDTLSLASQASYKLNIFRVSKLLLIHCLFIIYIPFHIYSGVI